MRTAASVLMLLTICSVPARSQSASRYEGLRYPPLPAGLESVFSSRVSNDDFVHYALEHVAAGTQHFLWLARDTLTVSNGRSALREVRTVLTLPPLRPKEALVQNCRVGNPDSSGQLDLVGIITLGPREVQRPRRAWRVDWQHERIVEIATRDVICIDEAYYERRGI